MREGIAVLAALAICSSVALAAPVPEVEPNDTLGTAQFIGEEFYPFGAVAIVGGVSPDDVDVFAFDVDAGVSIVVSVFSLDPGGDPVLGIYAPDGTLYDLVDDSFGLDPIWEGMLPEAGIWSFAVSGNDIDIFGGHDETFDYLMSWKIPEPATMALVGVGLFATVGMRRRK